MPALLFRRLSGLIIECRQFLETSDQRAEFAGLALTLDRTGVVTRDKSLLHHGELPFRRLV